MNQVAIIEDGSLIVGHDGKICHVSPHQDLLEQLGDAYDEEKLFETVIDAQDKVIVPGTFLKSRI